LDVPESTSILLTRGFNSCEEEPPAKEQIMNDINLLSIINMLAGAVIIGISVTMSSRSGHQFIKKQQANGLFTVSLILSGVYVLLIILSTKHVLSADALSGGVALVCSCLIAVMATMNRTLSNRLRTEIAEHNTSKDKIDDLSLTDQLTGLYNRRGFISIVEKHLIRLKRIRKKAVAFYIELNNLQEINEKFGYEQGDVILTNLATLMTATFREADVISRIGDDEFITFLVDADSEDMETVRKNFQNKLHTYNEKRSSRFKLSVNFGVSGLDPEINDSAFKLISQASAPVKRKRKPQKGTRFGQSENNNKNVTLIVSNMSSRTSPIDIKIFIDEELAIDDTFAPGMQNAWKPFHFKLARGKHRIKAKSVKGRTSLTQEFKVARDHWASIEYHTDDESESVAGSVSGKMLFKLHDVPVKHRLVKPAKKFV
jgi:diguanylate cyclase (GGDEF)-like protein